MTTNNNGKTRHNRKRRPAHGGGSPPSMEAVVLAGGKGTRLAPYTSILPKPLMPIGDRSILEIVLGQLGASGFQRVSLCVGYLAHLIEAVIGDRTADGLEIRYVRENEALGTAAPLRLVPGLESTFLAMNGDILTDLDYNDLVARHHACGNLVTIATHDRPIKIDYGVLRVGRNGDAHRVRGFREKPEMTSTVSMGIYVFEPRALDYIPSTEYFDFPQLVLALLAAGEPVGVYPFSGLWFDIGRRDDYERAAAVWLEHQVDGDSDPAFPLVTGSE